MNKKNLLVMAIVLGLGLTLSLLISLTHRPSTAYADPDTYYVRAGATGDCRSATAPCGSVQQAVDLATEPSDEVWIAGGTYTENLEITHTVKLLGGWDTAFVTRTATSTPTILDGNADHVVRIDAPDAAVTLDGLVLTNGQDGIHAYSGTITVTACVVENFARQGIEIDGTPLTGRILIQHNYIRNGEREGIEIDLGTVTVLTNIIENVGRHGILVQGGEALIQGNVIQTVGFDPSADYRGIEISGTHTVIGNHVIDVDERGIYAHGGVATIADNVVYDVGGDGIRADEDCPRAEIRGNTVYSTASDGIDTRAYTSIVASNTLSETAKDGAHVENVAMAQIQHNAVYSVENDGIDVRGDTVEVAYNMLSDVGKDGVHVEDTGMAYVHHNTVDRASDEGIDARGTTVRVDSNIVADCGGNGVKSEQATETFLNANQIYAAGDAGLDLDDAGAFTVTNNVVADSTTANVLIQTAAAPYNYLYHNTLVGSPSGQKGIGLDVNVPGITLTLANNIVVSHTIGISTVTGAHAIVSHSLLWANGSGTLVLSGTLTIFTPPMFVDPPNRNYHILPESSAVDNGVDVGVPADVDGEPRPIGQAPDIGADEVARKTYLPLILRAHEPG